MKDEELIAWLRRQGWKKDIAAADRIEALVNEVVLSRAAYESVSSLLLSVQQDCIKERQRAERLEAALREIAAEASVPVRTKKKGGINFKKMYKGWRKIATERIDIARAALTTEADNG